MCWSVWYNWARSIFWLSRSWGSPDVNITHTTLHFTSSVVWVLPPAPTYHLYEAWWQSLWWGWGVSGRLLQCSVAWQRRAQRQQSPSYVADTYLYTTEEQRRDILTHCSSLEETEAIWMDRIAPTVDYLSDTRLKYSVTFYHNIRMTDSSSDFHISKNILWPPWESKPVLVEFSKWRLSECSIRTSIATEIYRYRHRHTYFHFHRLIPSLDNFQNKTFICILVLFCPYLPPCWSSQWGYWAPNLRHR